MNESFDPPNIISRILMDWVRRGGIDETNVDNVAASIVGSHILSVVCRRMTLDEARLECLSLFDMPAGYYIGTDWEQDCLMVVGPTLAFCITRAAIDEGLIESLFAKQMEALVIQEDALCFGASLKLVPVPEKISQ